MDAPQGTHVQYCLPPGLVDPPDGWAISNPGESTIYPTGDDEEGINPYQPDCYRVVMLVKL